MTRILTHVATVMALAVLPACQPMADESSQPDTCNLAAYQSLVGTPAAQADFSDHKSVRIIPPNSPVTMDHRPDRLNVETDANDIIQRLYCG